MAVELPQPIAVYFGAVNARDIPGVIRCFAVSAVVQDEGQEYRGIVAIRGWMTAAGYGGMHEVELFSTRWWAVDGDTVLRTCRERHGQFA